MRVLDLIPAPGRGPRPVRPADRGGLGEAAHPGLPDLPSATAPGMPRPPGKSEGGGGGLWSSFISAAIVLWIWSTGRGQGMVGHRGQLRKQPGRGRADRVPTAQAEPPGPPTIIAGRELLERPEAPRPAPRQP